MHIRGVSSRLYGFDLLGAALGALLIIPVIPAFGAEGMVMLAASLALLAGLFLCSSADKGTQFFLVAGLVLFGILIPEASDISPIRIHETKRQFNASVEQSKIFATRWSPISRVDMAVTAADLDGFYDIWIDGGTNESAIFKWDGNEETLKPQDWHSSALIHSVKQDQDSNVMIIGPSGGKEVLFALSYGAKHVDAVEMDPSIVKFVQEPEIAEYMGGLYQKDKVSLTNDEGRSFLRRQPANHYDIIQFVNNYTPVAIGSGALNLSETFLITKESFYDYWDHLTDEGVLALHRGATLRVALTAIEALKELGVQNPENHIMITAGEVPYFEGFLLKKTPWTKEEERRIHSYMKTRARVGKKTFLWTPFHRTRDNLYSKILSQPTEELPKYYKSLGLNLSPTTDDKPFIEHFFTSGRG